MLGTAVYNAYKGSGHDVIGLAHSRATDRFEKLDLTDFPKTVAFFETERPKCESFTSPPPISQLDPLLTKSSKG